MIREDERYTTAISSSNLHSDTREHALISDVDVCTAAAWSPVRMGSALLRLVSEYRRPVRIDGLSPSDAVLLVGQLRTLPAVREQLAARLGRWGHERPEAAALALVAWWLHKTCSRCDGRRYEVVPGTSRTSAKLCGACGGTGEARLPGGEPGRRAAVWMDECIFAARSSMSRRLRRFTIR